MVTSAATNPSKPLAFPLRHTLYLYRHMISRGSHIQANGPVVRLLHATSSCCPPPQVVNHRADADVRSGGVGVDGVVSPASMPFSQHGDTAAILSGYEGMSPSDIAVQWNIQISEKAAAIPSDGPFISYCQKYVKTWIQLGIAIEALQKPGTDEEEKERLKQVDERPMQIPKIHSVQIRHCLKGSSQRWIENRLKCHARTAKRSVNQCQRLTRLVEPQPDNVIGLCGEVVRDVTSRWVVGQTACHQA